MKWHLPAFLLS